MEVIFNRSTVGAALINMNSVSTSPFRSSQSPPNESPSKGFNNWRNGFAFPNFLKDLISIGENTTRASRRQGSNIMGRQVSINILGSALIISSRMPS